MDAHRPQTNCVTEVLYPEAMERAKYLDDYLVNTGRTIGPLHGLPISLKDCFVTAGHPSSNGRFILLSVLRFNFDVGSPDA